MYTSGRGPGVTELWAADLDEGWRLTQAPAPHMCLTYGVLNYEGIVVVISKPMSALFLVFRS
jgi:hypothetical protein